MELSPVPRLASQLHDGFYHLVDLVVAELARRGHPGVTAIHEFALHAIGEGADTTAQLARDLGVSKQAAAKTVNALEQLGYLRRSADPSDARRQLLTVTKRGHDMARIGAAEFDRLRTEWIARIGTGKAKAAEAALLALQELS